MENLNVEKKVLLKVQVIIQVRFEFNYYVNKVMDRYKIEKIGIRVVGFLSIVFFILVISFVYVVICYKVIGI